MAALDWLWQGMPRWAFAAAWQPLLTDAPAPPPPPGPLRLQYAFGCLLYELWHIAIAPGQGVPEYMTGTTPDSKFSSGSTVVMDPPCIGEEGGLFDLDIGYGIFRVRRL